MHLHQAQSGSLYTPEGQRKYVTATERKRFITAALAWPRHEVGTLCLTLAHTGCRISEALRLTAGSVARDEGFISIRSLKRRAGQIVFREIPVPDEVVVALEAVHGLEAVESSMPLWSMSRGAAWEVVKQVMKKAGIADGPHASPKGLRHGFGIHAIRSGVPLNLVQRWLGHSSIETTSIYLQAMGVEEREIAARMWNSDDYPLMGAAG
jgi:integrase